MSPQNNTSSKHRKHELLANLEEKKNILEKKTIKKDHETKSNSHHTSKLTSTTYKNCFGRTRNPTSKFFFSKW